MQVSLDNTIVHISPIEIQPDDETTDLRMEGASAEEAEEWKDAIQVCNLCFWDKCNSF